MNKRILCLMLSVVLLFGLIPFGALRVSAASDFTPSDDIIEIIKEMEGFSKKPYWDYGQYTVGYGTRCPSEDYDRYMSEGITEEEAETLLVNHMAGMCKSINSFIDKYELDLNQNQFDAMLSFTYNCGTAWLYDTSKFRSAIINGDTGNDLLYPIALWCNAGGSILEGLIRRRLSEANIYLNGVYSRTVPANYCYVIYNANGGSTSTRVQAYDSDLTAEIIPTPTYEGHTFEGWYTAREGGTKVTVLDASVRNRTLYAHWSTGESGTDTPSDTEITGTAVNYKRQVKVSTLNVMQEPDASSNVLNAVKQNDLLTIIAEYTDENGVKWGKIQNSGWINLASTQEPAEVAGNEIDPVKVTVEYDGVNLREGPGTSYTVVGVAYDGDQFTITATATGSGYTWGKYDGGWIALTFTNFDELVNESDEKEEEETPEPTTVMGTVTTHDGLRIRTGAGTNHSIVGFLSYATRVEITEKKTVDGMTWGKISEGWISLDYVKLDETTTPSTPETTEPETETTEPETETTQPETKPTEPETPEETTPKSQMGTVNTEDLRIRSGPSTAYSILGYLNTGDRVEITETKSSGSMLWGKISEGWISMDYVDLDSDKEEDPETPDNATDTDGDYILGTVINTDNLRIRTGPSTDYSIAGYLSGGTVVKIYEQTVGDYMTWGKIDKGWISLDYIELDTSDMEIIETGVVIADEFLRIRSGPSTSYSIAGYLDPGDKVEIFEKKTSGGMVWGRISKGWISLDYVKLDSDISSDSSDTTTSSNYKTVDTDCLRIRSGAGLDNTIVGFLYEGARVEILETKTVAGMTWGRIDQGWISMDYVK